MAITHSRDRAIALRIESERFSSEERRREWPLLAVASFLVAVGLVLTFLGKTQNFAAQQDLIGHQELLQLNASPTADEIAPFLLNFTDPTERQLAAERMRDFLAEHAPLPNVGALARLRVGRSELETDSRWVSLRAALESRLENDKKTGNPVRHREISGVPLLELAKIKPTLVVRTPSEFLRQFAFWCGLYLLSFWIVHLGWRWRNFHGDPFVLPALQLLTGIGLMLAVTLRDPLRDSLEFRKFAWGCAVGCCLLLLPLFRFFQYRHWTQWTYTPLLGGFALLALLLLKGSGPTGSDAKVNLGPFQPVELIKILLVFFLAGYFARRWEWLRELRERRLVPGWLRWPEIPRLEHLLPVIAGVASALALFFVLKDLGPALVLGFTFIAMFAVARGRFGLAALATTLLVAGVSVGYRIGQPHTIVDRVDMWNSPWDNVVHGGDQIAHALWAFSTGGPWGSGPGHGDPGMIPAGHTDLVLASVAEEWGFLGTLSAFLLIGLLVQRAFRIARGASDEYSSFLAFGLGVLLALEMLLISGGVLDAVPLSGVVSPFLSSGNTAMLANFLIFAILLGISHHGGGSARFAASKPFSAPIAVVGLVLASLSFALLARAANFQIFAADRYLGQDARIVAEDGVKRPEHNPRLNSLMHQIPRGDIFDRNGVLLATSSWPELLRNRDRLAKLGVSEAQFGSPLETRHYPFGPLAVQILGDLRTGENFHASNASLIEHDSNSQLQGYRDAHELAPLIRYRHYPGYGPLRELRERDRDVHASIDIRLQQKLADIMSRRLGRTGAKGAALVLEPQSGDVLAMVNAPMPSGGGPNSPDELLDRARYGQYPPGSTFKLVTAIAALRKDPFLTHQKFSCVRLPDGRVGTRIPGWNRPIRDDIKDHAHGTLDMMRAITQSCNAYFAQLGVYKVGSDQLRDTAQMFEIPPGDPREFQRMLPFSSYGQGPVLATPFKIARVTATIANGGAMPQGRWVLGPSNTRTETPRRILDPGPAAFLAEAMRSVVTGGTGRAAMAGLDIAVAGKTGTAQVENGEPHSWFTGFAPYAGDRRIVFAVVVEHGGYGAKSAAPIAREIVEAARDLGIIGSSTPAPVTETR